MGASSAYLDSGCSGEVRGEEIAERAILVGGRGGAHRGQESLMG
jgi:hypothetical protein